MGPDSRALRRDRLDTRTVAVSGLRAVVLCAALLPVAPLQAASAPEAALEPRTGHAFALDSGRPVYREVHEPEVVAGKLVSDPPPASN